MSNKFKGNCSECGTTVPPHSGTVRKVGGRWQVRCGSHRHGGGRRVPSGRRMSNGDFTVSVHEDDVFDAMKDGFR